MSEREAQPRSAANRRTPRRANPAADVGNFLTLGTLTDAEELALALVLWKSLRCHGAFDPKGNPTFESVELGEKALALANGIGEGGVPDTAVPAEAGEGHADVDGVKRFLQPPPQ